MSIFPDPLLIVLQAIPFLVTMAVLSKLVFKPMAEYLQERDDATVGTRETAVQLQKEAAAKLDEYESRMKEARSEMTGLRARRRSEALEERDAAIVEARGEADVAIDKALEVIATEKAAASTQMQTISTALAADITSTVLGRAAGAAPAK